MIFRQLFESTSCTYTYILGCAKSKQALIIDPVLEMVSRDAKLIRELRLKLNYLVNTHVHADHVTGTGKLKENNYFPEAKSILSKKTDAYADILLDHGDIIKISDSMELEVRHTPGHTNSCVTYVCHSKKMAFVGDALLIRGCGRTDFQQGSAKINFKKQVIVLGDARSLYKSVHKHILSLPREYKLFPAHDYTGQMMTTVGEELEYNTRLTKSEDEFVEIMSNLKLPYPKQIDKSVPANVVCGIPEKMSKNLRKKILN